MGSTSGRKKAHRRDGGRSSFSGVDLILAAMPPPDRHADLRSDDVSRFFCVKGHG